MIFSSSTLVFTDRMEAKGMSDLKVVSCIVIIVDKGLCQLPVKELADAVRL